MMKTDLGISVTWDVTRKWMDALQGDTPRWSNSKPPVDTKTKVAF